jgi:acyl-CoA dehydrogenase
MLILWLIALFATALTLAYRRATLAQSTLAAALLIVPVLLLPGTAVAFKMLLGGALLAMASLNVDGLRRTLITAPALARYRSVLPKMSPTEQQALDAGTVWWEGELFGGKPTWNRLLGCPTPRLSHEEQRFLEGPVNELCAMLDEWQITHEQADLPPQVWDYLKANGFFAMIIPKKYGGLEFSAYAHSCVLGRITSRSSTCGSTVAVPNSLGPAELLLKYGTDAQKEHYLPRLARGEEIPCFALTSPTAGSDATSIIDRGEICRDYYDGEEVLGIRLDFDKRYITLAPVATVIGLAFKLYDPQRLLGPREEIGITCALIPASTPGVYTGRRHFPLNVPFQNGPVRGENVFVPLDFIIGGAERAGDGWRMLVECLSVGRCISLPSNATGGAKKALAATGAYARIRKQFGMPIGRFEGVQAPLARLAGNTYVMDATRTLTAGAVDLGEEPSVASAIVKYHVTEIAREVANDAMDIHGGKGIMLGPRNYLARGYQSVPVLITVEGANILTRSLIIYGQGAVRCHPYILKEMRAAADEDRTRAVRLFDEAFFGHIGHVLANAARALVSGATAARFLESPTPGPARRFYRQAGRLSACFALTSDVCMLTYGGALKKKESISARLGDVLSHLFLVSAALKRFDDDDAPAEDFPLLQWVCETWLHRAQQTLFEIVRNLPNRPVAFALRLVLFPTGRDLSPPSDALTHAVADQFIRCSETRERLIQGAYLEREASNPAGLLDALLETADEAEPMEKKVRAAAREGRIHSGAWVQMIRDAGTAGVLSRDEVELLEDYDRRVMDIIHVDDFDPWELAAKPRRRSVKPARSLVDA